MKGTKCYYCDSAVETDNEDCLCNDCSRTVYGSNHTLSAIIIISILLMVVWSLVNVLF